MLRGNRTAQSPALQRVAIRSPKDPWEVVSAARNLRRNQFGSNTGNLLFAHAAHRLLSTGRTTVHSNRLRISAMESVRLNERADVFVVPLANAFRLSFQQKLVRLTAMIEQLRIPVTVLSVGAQAGIQGDTSRLAPIDADVKRFVAAVLDRSPSIGVRGEITYDYLRRLGFSDVEVIGCPAMFMYGADVAVARKVQELTAQSRLAVGVSPYVGAVGPIVRANLDRYPDLTYIAQDIATLRLLLEGRSLLEDRHGPDIPVHRSHPLIAEGKTRIFLDALPWLEHLRQRDFYFGTRIHGTIAALIAGTPAVLVAHDARTRELADYHRIPYRAIKGLPGDVDAADLYAEADYSDLHRAHPERLRTFLDYLERHRLDHIYAPGASPEAFDRRLGTVAFPPPVTARLTRPLVPK